MNDTKISVIIPIYNEEKHLQRCVDSVIAQQDSVYEIILVDDGSQDKSIDICRAYEKENEKITVLHKQNEGLGYARNSGLDMAKGDYIFFLDSDDWVPSGIFEYLKKVIHENDVDIVCFPLEYTYNSEYHDIISPKEKIEILDKCQIMEAYLQKKITTTACAKLYRKSIFDNVRFSKVPLHEDAYSMHLFLEKAERVLLTNRIGYVQVIQTESLTQKKFTKKSMLSIECGERLLNFVDEKYPNLHVYALYGLAFRCYALMKKILTDNSYEDFKEEYEILEEKLKENGRRLPRNLLDDDMYKRVRLFSKHTKWLKILYSNVTCAKMTDCMLTWLNRIF